MKEGPCEAWNSWNLDFTLLCGIYLNLPIHSGVVNDSSLFFSHNPGLSLTKIHHLDVRAVTWGLKAKIKIFYVSGIWPIAIGEGWICPINLLRGQWFDRQPIHVIRAQWLNVTLQSFKFEAWVTSNDCRAILFSFWKRPTSLDGESPHDESESVGR